MLYATRRKRAECSFFLEILGPNEEPGCKIQICFMSYNYYTISKEIIKINDRYRRCPFLQHKISTIMQYNNNVLR